MNVGKDFVKLFLKQKDNPNPRWFTSIVFVLREDLRRRLQRVQ